MMQLFSLMDDSIITTAKFRSNVAHLLTTQVSPSLAALHVHRAAIQSRSLVTLTPLHCPRCTHAPIFTRVVANASKQRTRRRSTTKNVKRGNDNKTHSVQTRKPESSSSSSSPRGSRVRIMKSCAACGYVGEEAFERSEDSSSYENNEQASRSVHPGTDLDGALSSSSVPVSRSVTPALVKETETRSNTQDISIQSSAAKLKAKQAQATTTVARNTGSPMTQPEPPHVSSPSTLEVLQSRSAVKRQKKKAGLQEMLARSKVRKQAEKDHGQDGGNLAAFLSGL
ncbi:hypothetical protein A7U60_g8844 [Sanghuangporus baumii]|uniref:Uncharacterized protein n=1 Tax=Sanghuangporus baumii TaxID=108892 RepID=A0A9Q5N471_SANBA|nr:hypothetical protein A7U60_g8844 [Sanghuangporus baumii]